MQRAKTQRAKTQRATAGQETTGAVNSMATFSEDMLQALNAVLEAERASVEVEVALAASATDFSEREALIAMGRSDAEACSALHERLEQSGAVVTPWVSKIVLEILAQDRYDDRLRAFAAHQRAIRAQIQLLLAEGDVDRETGGILHEIVEAHVQHALWADLRAEEFADSRLMEFKGAGVGWVRRAPEPTALVANGPRSLMIVPPPSGRQTSRATPARGAETNGAHPVDTASPADAES